METSSEQDKNADKVIAGMVASITAAAVLPFVIDWTISASILGTGVVSIGLCYGVKLTKEEAWKLIKQFIHAAGFWFTFTNFGSQIVSQFLEFTGLGSVVGLTLQITSAIAVTYAIGAAAKEYFKGERDMNRIGQTVRDNYRSNN